VANRMTPVQAAKVLGIRPQIVYGFIKHNRVKTYDNPSGKTQLVDYDEVSKVAGGIQHHREKDPTTGKPIRRDANVRPGSLLSYHGELVKKPKKPRAHRLVVVDHVETSKDTGLKYVVTKKGDWESGVIHESERLADAITKGKCFIEPPEQVIAVLMWSFAREDNIPLAASLGKWAEDNGIQVPDLQEHYKEAVRLIDPNEPVEAYNTQE
jgi:hypothetical protein